MTTLQKLPGCDKNIGMVVGKKRKEKVLRKSPQPSAFSTRQPCGKFLVKQKERKTTVWALPGCDNNIRIVGVQKI
jgi:hypothetical protein